MGTPHGRERFPPPDGRVPELRLGLKRLQAPPDGDEGLMRAEEAGMCVQAPPDGDEGVPDAGRRRSAEDLHEQRPDASGDRGDRRERGNPPRPPVLGLLKGADADILHRRLWEHALGWLKEKRARQPLNGIILTLDLPDLLTADKRRREHLLQALRSRLQDIRQHLHCQLPVYVVLTRLDLLQGFAALFQSLNRQDRDAILGVTFTRRAHENDDWRTELNAFWQTWVDRMNLALPDLMVAQTHTRASLFSFSRQMQGSREPLVSLLEGLLDGENMNVMLRGVYLTSSLQRGQMDDIFTQSAARQYRLGNNPLASWPLVDTAPYFTRSLFPQALLAEPNLATESRAWLIRSRRRLTVFSATGGVASRQGLNAIRCLRMACSIMVEITWWCSSTVLRESPPPVFLFCPGLSSMA